MKKYFLIALVAVISLGLTNCGSDDDGSINQQTLTGGEWKFTTFTIDTVDKTSTLDACDLLETFSFTDDGKFVNKYYEKNATSGTCELKTTATGKWVTDGNAGTSPRFKLTFDDPVNDPITFVLGLLDLAYGYEEDTPTGKSVYAYEFRKQ